MEKKPDINGLKVVMMKVISNLEFKLMKSRKMFR